MTEPQNVYSVEYYDSYQGTCTMDVPANSEKEANEIFIRFMKKIPTGIFLIV